MKHRRTALTACFVVVSGLGIAGMMAGGCGGDDTAPAASAGAGGTAGTGAAGSMAGSAGTGGTSAGSAGAAEAGAKDGSSFTDADVGMCKAALAGDTGLSCTDSCICNTCPKEGLGCLGQAACRAIITCAAEKMCTAITCLDSENCLGIITANPTGLAPAKAFGDCGQGCALKCAAEAGPPPEAGGDGPKSDAPAASDAPADTGSAADADNEGG